MSESKNFGRRDVLRRALIVLAAAPVMGSALASCGGEVSCSSGGLATPQLAIRSAVHYLAHSPVATRHCSGCQLYTGAANACGTCSSVPGSINPTGTCDAFVART